MAVKMVIASVDGGKSFVGVYTTFERIDGTDCELHRTASFDKLPSRDADLPSAFRKQYSADNVFTIASTNVHGVTTVDVAKPGAPAAAKGAK